MDSRGFAAVAAFLAVLSICLHQGDAIKCWVCRSDADPKCADPFDNSTLPITDCSKEPFLNHLPNIRPNLCRKIRQKVNGKWRYIRSCAYLGEPGIGGDERYCLMRSGTYNIFMEYCTCNSKDGCNAAPATTSLSWLAAVSAAAVAAFQFA
ncbi:UPAR/Ly6 domain-containing protein crok-like [Cloeon dipterum]|uniref:UPAR/Ly6 domain-containing protein crok-like n=1 Tax=Cloeon dipterum TaxID=197152 RepID=UPI0032206D8E